MGWEMLFWVVVIVAVPTVLWFLQSAPPRSSRKSDDHRDRGEIPREREEP